MSITYLETYLVIVCLLCLHPPKSKLHESKSLVSFASQNSAWLGVGARERILNKWIMRIHPVITPPANTSERCQPATQIKSDIVRKTTVQSNCRKCLKNTDCHVNAAPGNKHRTEISRGAYIPTPLTKKKTKTVFFLCRCLLRPDAERS